MRPYAIFTDLEGSLLDALTGDFSPAGPMLQKLRGASVPVIPVSTRTIDELEPLARALEITDAMIIESGSAIARYTGNGWELEACAASAETLLDVIREIEDQTGAELTVYSALPPDEAARLSGLSGESLIRSANRRFEEPFVLERGNIEDVIAAADTMGFAVRRGRRFYHLLRKCNEGEAFTRLREELACGVAVGLGDAPIDAGFLSRSDVAVIIPRADGTPDAELVARVPHARLAPAPGPIGWAAAVGQICFTN
jgi:mannosyl-3-phosphoglycerate phosphatase